MNSTKNAEVHQWWREETLIISFMIDKIFVS